MCAFTLTHHIKIDSNGIWWLTRCLNLEKKMGEKTTQGEARGLTHTQQVHARVSANASAIRTTTWVKMEKKRAPEYSGSLLLKHTTEESTHCHMHASSHNSAHLSFDLKATGPLYHWATSKETGRNWARKPLTAFRWTIGDIHRVQRLTVRKCSLFPLHTYNYPDRSLRIVKLNFRAVR